ncbi:AI-2E family transporter [Metabacillus idriensis]|uniref:AI-2E family transporter n=1 Tax=Metabacillus idriensis TaxID=324768 RepID=UPI0008A92711|nr:AI-2E family transporter [Metabacillus idriensis]MCM3596339.1 AI-2E family transporter [Metabacillus idriensis]OHR71242.1 AI-2E family transporter [Bacillus sp. HMSC76G11]
MKERYFKWLMRIGIFLLCLLSIYLFLKLRVLWDPFFIIIKAILLPFLIAGFITYLLHPVIEKLHSTGVPRTLSILIIYTLFFGGIGYGLYKGIPVIIAQLKDLSESFPVFEQKYQGWLSTVHDHTDRFPEEVHTRIETAFQNIEAWFSYWIDKILNSLGRVFDYLLIIALIPFLVFYMLKDYEQIKKAAWYLTPKRWRPEAVIFVRDVDQSLGNYIRGQLLVCFIIGFLAFISLWFFDIKYPLVIGILIGITNVIPYFGPIIGAVPAVIIAASMSMDTVLIVIIIIFSLQFIEGNILGPLIVGRSLHMHPIVIMLALLAGGEIAGIIGMILAVPVLAVLKVTMMHLVHLRRQH